MNQVQQIQDEIKKDFELLGDLEEALRTERNPIEKRKLQKDINERRDIINQRKDELRLSEREKGLQNYDINILVNDVRKLHLKNIQAQCGTLKILDVSESININDIFVEVNILEKPTSYLRSNLINSSETFDPDKEEFDRFLLGKVVQPRLPGLDVVKQYSKLMVLGKPGAGKSTFLQHIAILCSEGHFQDFLVPLFIRLKTFADETRGKDINLMDYISQYLDTSITSIGIPSHSILSRLLLSGRVLLLYDGLDEIPTEDSEKIVEKIRIFCEKYHRNHYIISCRTATGSYLIRGFTEVEIADFNEKQIDNFAKKWFRHGDAHKAKQFIEKLNEPKNIQIKEIAVTPILLILKCLVFQEQGEFPDNRARLYEEGIHILLNKWDTARGILRKSRYYRYQDLSYDDRKHLLQHIAYTTFINKKYFFDEDEVSRYIQEYYKNSRYSIDAKILEEDSKAILKDIELQHGLLIERAKAIYSFSHLTFQEYLVAKKCVGEILDDSNLLIVQKLCKHLKDTHWKEVFSLARDMLQNVDNLQKLKHKIDLFISTESEIQMLLTLINEKSLLVQNLYKPAAIRAFYLGLILPHRYDFSLASYIDTKMGIDIQESFNLNNKYSSINHHDDSLLLIFDLALIKAYLNDFSLLFRLAEIDDLKYNDNFKILLGQLKCQIFAFERKYSNIMRVKCEEVSGTSRSDPFKETTNQQKRKRKGLLDFLNNPGKAKDLNLDNEEERREYTISDIDDADRLREGSIERLRQEIKKWLENHLPQYKNIADIHILNGKQKEIIQDYYNINIFLVHCINSSTQLNSEARENFKDTLLLPMEIKIIGDRPPLP